MINEHERRRDFFPRSFVYLGRGTTPTFISCDLNYVEWRIMTAIVNIDEFPNSTLIATLNCRRKFERP